MGDEGITGDLLRTYADFSINPSYIKITPKRGSWVFGNRIINPGSTTTCPLSAQVYIGLQKSEEKIAPLPKDTLVLPFFNEISHSHSDERYKLERVGFCGKFAPDGCPNESASYQFHMEPLFSGDGGTKATYFFSDGRKVELGRNISNFVVEFKEGDRLELKFLLPGSRLEDSLICDIEIHYGEE